MYGATYLVTRRLTCTVCNGQGKFVHPDGDTERCTGCGARGYTESDAVPLTDALRDLGILDRFAALESAVRQVERTAGRAAYNASVIANGGLPD